MIRHIFKIIWNERKTNAWIVLEYILVFCVLWFCVDYLYYMGKCYWEPVGFDTKNTYLIEMQKKTRYALQQYRRKQRNGKGGQTGTGANASEPCKKLSGCRKCMFFQMGGSF